MKWNDNNATFPRALHNRIHSFCVQFCFTFFAGLAHSLGLATNSRQLFQSIMLSTVDHPFAIHSICEPNDSVFIYRRMEWKRTNPLKMHKQSLCVKYQKRAHTIPSRSLAFLLLQWFGASIWTHTLGRVSHCKCASKQNKRRNTDKNYEYMRTKRRQWHHDHRIASNQRGNEPRINK